MAKKIIDKIRDKLFVISEELKDGFSISDKNNMVIEDVIGTNLPVLTNFERFSKSSDLYSLEKASFNIYNSVKTLREEEELSEFVRSNKNFDNVKLKKLYFKKGLNEKFPKFDIDKYLDLLNNPILSVKSYTGKVIKFDLFWVKKMIIAINQMIFNEMDLYVLNIGKEGSGKSCWSSQQILYLHYFFTTIGLIDYAYDVRRMFFADILSFNEENNNQLKNDFFRIVCLDEGNELNRGNYRDENIMEFKYSMRTERKNLRVVFINMQQIGELDTSVSLSRVNFIYDCQMSGDKTTGTLKKGFGDMYIIPRDEYIYSAKYKKIFRRNDILNAFANKLDKKKDYYTGLPKEFIVNDFKFDDIWGFDKEEYDSHVKDETKSHKFKKSIKLTTLQAYILLTKFGDFKRLKLFDLKNGRDKKKYDVLYKFFEKLKSYFDDNPDRIIGLEKFYGAVYDDKEDDVEVVIDGIEH